MQFYLSLNETHLLNNRKGEGKGERTDKNITPPGATYCSGLMHRFAGGNVFLLVFKGIYFVARLSRVPFPSQTRKVSRRHSEYGLS